MESRQLLIHAQRLQALAHAGLAYASSAYDRECYEEIRAISVSLQTKTDTKLQSSTSEQRLVRDGREILMISEKGDKGRWTLPGGWADVGCTPFEVPAKEVHEETGLIGHAPARPLR